MKLKGNTIEFLSTPSARRATIFIRSGMALLLFLSTPSARRATGASVAFDQYEGISIHALREAGLTPGKYFYPRPPRGGRHGAVVVLEGLFQFLSTPSARRATRFPAALPAITRDFYPRPPRGGRPMSSSFFSSVMEFLSTPSARRATRGLSGTIRMTIFLSTPSARRAT